MTRKLFEQSMNSFVSRRTLLQGGAGLIGGTMLSSGMSRPALAVGMAPIGTWPDGSKGDTVFIGASVPRTGTYAVQGEDELKGYQLAVEHINEGNELVKKISPKTKKGVLGKQLKLGVADFAAKPNEAVQAQQRFISENKAVMITVEPRWSRSRSTSWRSAKRSCSSAAFRVPTTLPEKTACATVSGRTSSDRPRRRP